VKCERYRPQNNIVVCYLVAVPFPQSHSCFDPSCNAQTGVIPTRREIHSSRISTQHHLAKAFTPCERHNPQTMYAYLKENPSDVINALAKTQPGNVMQYVDEIGDGWRDSSTRRRQKPSSKTSTETQIQLIIVGDTNEGERHSFIIGSSTTLKTLFNDYAEKRGDSLRSLRFSYGGKTLFLSSVGNKTPDELNMQDQDVIIVHGTNASPEKNRGSTNDKNTLAPKKVKTINNSTRKTKGKGKTKKQSIKQEEPVKIKTLEEYKAQHSNILSKLHEEVHPHLKEIRTRLNALELERQPRKQKRKKKGKTKIKHCVDNQALPNSGIGGKAGKPYFIVQVGEVQNLYKTTKPSQKSPCSATLDLHGCTREEALVKLDENLTAWVDNAMHGSYPFVISAKIICGCGNQILSETVKKWIREHAQVANAKKNSIL